MYADPSLVRKNVMAIKVNAEELALLKAAADKAGLQLSTFCRVAGMAQIRKELELINMTSVL